MRTETAAHPRARARTGNANAHAAASESHVYSPAKLYAVVLAMHEFGVAAADVLADTGLRVDDLTNPDTLTSSAQYLTATRHAARLRPDTAAGLRAGQHLHASSIGMFGYALLCAVSLRHAFDTGVRYHQLANATMQVDWVQQGADVVWQFSKNSKVALDRLSAEHYRFLVDLQLACQVTITRDIMGDWCVPARVRMEGPAPSYVQEMAAVFNCPVEFDQGVNELHYPAAWLTLAPPLANPIAAAQASRSCAAMLEDLQRKSGISSLVYGELTRTPGQFPDIEQVASALCMTSRTLRRKLDAENASYSDLFDQVRQALAIDYLHTGYLHHDDIAAALGFSDVTNFRRAFKRWTGKTLGAYQQSVLVNGSATRQA
ncbi:AraC family transcriptional regulator [Acidovorax sp. D2M1]|uniref:AraC family transcriptional regulator n=2 Tax=Acidovorax benzenivorans TaxID=2987520 RepID=A0ABT5S3F5_9BURK|nr:AraC family transcriptional regulator [Acidovorax benzenivorans]MDD2180485.1 AraC family transcriptional regulator [Acidovorax benzenivorans]